METGQSSLTNLCDIVEPSPVSWWPPAPGWWMLLGFAALATCLAAYYLVRRWWNGAYRRTAIAKIHSSTSVADVAVILKRTALAAFPRNEVASLSGTDWCQWLGDTCGRTPSPTVAANLTTGVFANLDSNDLTPVKEFATYWVTHHDIAEGGPEC